MDATQLEGFFFRPPAITAAERAASHRQSSDRYRPPTVHMERAPFHLDLAAVLPKRTQAIAQARKLVFHTVGDTGGVHGTGAQINVADHMTRQIRHSQMPDQPSFFYHLGDVIYENGEDNCYHDQFYHPYRDYPAPIFAIPGNHDGSTLDPEQTIVPFMKHFCASEATHAPESGHSFRPTMIQPNCYWQLNTPMATIIGLYSNVSGELDNTDKGETQQKDWLAAQLKDAPTDRCLVVAVHHPLYSFGHHGGIVRVREALEFAMEQSGRTPDIILTGHEHCYQRFARKRNGWHIPVLVVGGGGVSGYDDLANVKAKTEPPPNVKLEAYEDEHPGFLRLTIEPDRLIGEYFTVPKAGKEEDAEKLRDQFTLNLLTHKLVD